MHSGVSCVFENGGRNVQMETVQGGKSPYWQCVINYRYTVYVLNCLWEITDEELRTVSFSPPTTFWLDTCVFVDNATARDSDDRNLSERRSTRLPRFRRRVWPLAAIDISWTARPSIHHARTPLKTCRWTPFSCRSSSSVQAWSSRAVPA